MTDFEVAVINAIRTELPLTVHRGCFFHFSQCIFRRIQESGLQIRYREDPELALTLKMLPALEFVPANEVVPTFEYLVNTSTFPEEIQRVVDISGIRHISHTKCGTALQVSADHPNIWKFISALKREQRFNEIQIEQSLSGIQSSNPRRVYRDWAERLSRLVENYRSNSSVLDYLRGVAHNLSF
ncbi:uncharacterized protein LOC143912539 [Arctopsyche grandis]|uniref:uncharacterized protein LOC143912539 n=1 Tax=Arctopsyche grandis TaxID=121162 RepID=UPI00406D99FE